MPNGCGRGLYGYDYDRITQTRSINEAEAAVVCQMFEWKLSGVSNCAIARRLRKLGIRTKTGAQWDPRTVRNILMNEAYTGVQWWGKHRYEKIRGGKRKISLKPPEEWIQLVGFSPRIIDPASSKPFRAPWPAALVVAAGGITSSHRFSPVGNVAVQFAGPRNSRVVILTTGAWGHSAMKIVPGSVIYRRCGLISWSPSYFEHIRAAVQDPTGIISDLRSASGDGGADLDLRISRLKGRVTKVRLEVASLSIQQAKGLIDLEMFETLVAPKNHLLAQYEKESALLVEQKDRTEGFDKFEEQVRAVFLRYANGLDSLDSEGMQQLMRLLNIRLVAGPGRLLVTGVLDPSLFTTGRTLA